MKSKTRLQSYRALMKDELIHNKPVAKKNVSQAAGDIERVFGREINNLERIKENLNNGSMEIGSKRLVSRSLAY